MQENYRKYFEIKEKYEIRDFNRKKELAFLRFELAVKLAKLMDDIGTKRHTERCQILGIKYTPIPKRKNALRQ